MKKFLSFLVAVCLTLLLISPSFATITQTDTNEIFISSGIMPNDVVKFKQIINENKFKKKWTIEICSPGGHTSIGISIYNILRELSKNGVEITTVVRGEAASMGAIIFLAGDKRIVYEGAHIMFHKAFQANSIGVKMVPAKGSDNEKALGIINNFFIKLMKKFYNGDEKKVDELLTKETRYTAKELYELGIATEYIDLTE